jgi:hypothetical protein
MFTRGTWKRMKEKKSERENENVKSARGIRQASWFYDELNFTIKLLPPKYHLYVVQTNNQLG